MFIVMLLHKTVFCRNLAKLVLVYLRVVLDHFLQAITKYREFHLYILDVAPPNVVEETSTGNCLFTWGQLEYFSLGEKLLILSFLHR